MEMDLSLPSQVRAGVVAKERSMRIFRDAENIAGSASGRSHKQRYAVYHSQATKLPRWSCTREANLLSAHQTRSLRTGPTRPIGQPDFFQHRTDG